MKYLSRILPFLNDTLPVWFIRPINILMGASLLVVRIRERPRDFDMHIFYSRWQNVSSMSFSCSPMSEEEGGPPETRHINQVIYAVGASFENRGISAYWTFDDTQEGWSIMEDFHHLYGETELEA